ncbi:MULTISPECIES: transcriptional regulator FeaR [unclassified Pseudomonas]|uniref:transcriptional regulator FeaR n=1 Tax=unclassified Pseudomonas TaxID=196821 RepID=UPI00160E279A|nr:MULTISPECIES: transcriptional regulator FeaR [unclassified Pseudomonas]MBB6290497.1 AraC family transcriptional activator of tynA and feaB [Pseudomonas sp. SJZ073]MBB6315776.1 AraC family transcriptional activator of tynA and feaB [Pseudomonas sp. JAI120]
MNYTSEGNTLFEAWLEQLNQTCGRFDACALGDGFRGKLTPFEQGAIRMSVVDLAAVRLVRGHREVSNDDKSHFYTVFQLEGFSNIAQGEAKITLKKGDITLIDASTPCSLDYSAESRQLSLILPRHYLEQGGTSGIRCTPLPFIPAGQPLTELAFSLVGQAMNQQGWDQLASEAALDAVAALLRPPLNAGDAIPDASKRLFAKASAFIEENLSNAALCPELIAKEIGVSVRGLYRVFARNGLVVAQFIRNRRLHHCARLLREGGPEQKLSALGYDYGFSDSSYFSTVFKTRFGMTPGEYRRLHTH